MLNDNYGDLKTDFVISYVTECLNRNYGINDIIKEANYASNCLDNVLASNNRKAFAKLAASTDFLAAIGDASMASKLSLPLALAAAAGSTYLGHRIGTTLGNADASDIFDAKESDIQDQTQEIKNLTKLIKLRQLAKEEARERRSTPSRRQLF